MCSCARQLLVRCCVTAACCSLLAACCLLLDACCLLHAACCLLLAAACCLLLAAACCLLLAACCLLLLAAACCPLRTHLPCPQEERTENEETKRHTFLVGILKIHHKSEPLEKILKWVQITKFCHMSQNKFAQKKGPQNTRHST